MDKRETLELFQKQSLKIGEISNVHLRTDTISVKRLKFCPAAVKDMAKLLMTYLNVSIRAIYGLV